MKKDVIIIGNGPAGLSSAIYGLRAGYSVRILTDNPMHGGQIATTYEIENYPGIAHAGGAELGQMMWEHAKGLGAELSVERVSSIEDMGSLKKVVTNKETYEAKGVIIATGATHRKLSIPGENTLAGSGVSYCATCDGAFFKNKTVAVVGGGDVALEDALFLSRFAEKVYLIHRRDEFRGAKILQNQVLENEKIIPIYDTIVTEVKGSMKVEGIVTENKKTGEQGEIPVNGLFIAVGTEPNLSDITGLPARDEAGYIIAGEDCITDIPGVFAAGDVRTKMLRQVITAAADGACAISSLQKYLQKLSQG